MPYNNHAEQNYPITVKDQISKHEPYRLKWSAAILETIKYDHPNISPIGVQSWAVKDKSNVVIIGESIAFIVHKNGKIYTKKSHQLEEISQAEYRIKYNNTLGANEIEKDINKSMPTCERWLRWKITLDSKYRIIDKKIICHLKYGSKKDDKPNNCNKQKQHQTKDYRLITDDCTHEMKFQSHLSEMMNHHKMAYEKSEICQHQKTSKKSETMGVFGKVSDEIAKKTNWVTQWLIKITINSWPLIHYMIKKMNDLNKQVEQSHGWKIICVLIQFLIAKQFIFSTPVIIIVSISIIYLLNKNKIDQFILTFLQACRDWIKKDDLTIQGELNTSIKTEKLEQNKIVAPKMDKKNKDNDEKNTHYPRP